MSWINVGEVYYVLRRDQGAAEAETTLRDLRPRLSLDLPSEERVIQAARLKADHRFAYADACAAATTMAHDRSAPDRRPELSQPRVPWRVEDLRG